MSFVPKVWKDFPDQSTAITAAALIDLETRLSAYTDTGVAGVDLSSLVTLAPGSSTRNVIQPSGDFKALIVKNNAAQTVNPFEVQSSASVALVSVNSTGTLTASALVGTSGLSLPDTAGTTTKGITFGADTTLYRNAANQLFTNATSLRMTGGSAQLQLSGTNNVLYGDGGASGYRASGHQFQDAAASYTPFEVKAAAAITTVRTIIKGIASQSGNLTEWQDSNSAILASINSSGGMNFPATDGSTSKGLTFQNGGIQFYNSQTSVMRLTNAGLQVPNSDVTVGNNVVAQSGTAGKVRLGNNTSTIASVLFGSAEDAAITRTAAGELTVQAGGSNPTKLLVKGTTSQSTTGLIEVQDSSAVLKLSVDSNGTVVSKGNVYALNGAAQQIFLGNDASLATVGFGSGPDHKLRRTAAGEVTHESVGVATKLIVRGSSSQSSTNLQEWTDSTPTVLTRITSAGHLTGPDSFTITSSGTVLLLKGPVVNAQVSTDFRVQDSSGATQPFTVQTATAVGTVKSVIKGVSGQTGNLTEWQTSANAMILAVQSNGSLIWNTGATLDVSNAGGSASNTLSARVGNYFRVLNSGASFNAFMVRGAGETGIGKAIDSDNGGGAGPMLGLGNITTAPTSNASTGGFLYAEAGALKWRGSAGTVTVLAPA